MLLKNRLVVFTLISLLIAMITMCFYESILSVRLIEQGVQESNVGYIFGIAALCYIVASPIYGLLAKYIGGMYTI